jgi:hypothetical protein
MSKILIVKSEKRLPQNEFTPLLGGYLTRGLFAATEALLCGLYVCAFRKLKMVDNLDVLNRQVAPGQYFAQAIRLRGLEKYIVVFIV